MGDELKVQLSEDGADAERLHTLTGYLRRELLQLDVEDVATLTAGEPPDGARAVDALAVGGLLVSLSNSAGLRAVVSTLRRWLAGSDGIRRTVKLEMDGDVIEVSEVSAAEQERLIDVFVSRHSRTEG